MMIFDNYNIACEEWKKNNYEKSIEYFTKAINENNLIGISFSEAYFYRAAAYYYINDFENALKDFTESSSSKFDDFKLYFFRGLTYFSLKKYYEAITDFEKVIELNKDFQNVNINLYEAYKIVDKSDLALALAKKIINSNPRAINDISKLGAKYLDCDSYQIAKQIYSDLFFLIPKSVSAIQGLAISNGHLKNYSESITFFNLLIKLDPENSESHIKNRDLSYKELINNDSQSGLFEKLEVYNNQASIKKNQTNKEQENLEEKKISVTLIIFSLLGIVLSYIFKTPYDDYKDEWERLQYTNKDVPIYFYKTDVFENEFDLKFILTSLTILFGVGIYLYKFKRDSEIKNFFKKVIPTGFLYVKIIKNGALFYFTDNTTKRINYFGIIILILILLIIILLVFSKPYQH